MVEWEELCAACFVHQGIGFLRGGAGVGFAEALPKFMHFKLCKQFIMITNDVIGIWRG